VFISSISDEAVQDSNNSPDDCLDPFRGIHLDANTVEPFPQQDWKTRNLSSELYDHLGYHLGSYGCVSELCWPRGLQMVLQNPPKELLETSANLRSKLKWWSMIPEKFPRVSSLPPRTLLTASRLSFPGFH
jgi:hypothetical protein